MEIPIQCEALVDQGRYIGSDPVGYGCTRPAKFDLQGLPLCPDCMKLLEEEPARISFPKKALGVSGQTKLIREIFDRLTGGPVYARPTKRDLEIWATPVDIDLGQD